MASGTARAVTHCILTAPVCAIAMWCRADGRLERCPRGAADATEHYIESAGHIFSLVHRALVAVAERPDQEVEPSNQLQLVPYLGFAVMPVWTDMRSKCTPHVYLYTVRIRCINGAIHSFRPPLLPFYPLDSGGWPFGGGGHLEGWPFSEYFHLPRILVTMPCTLTIFHINFRQ